VGLLSPAHPDDPDRDGLKAYQGLGYFHPVIGAVLALCLLSLAGLPPTAGFFGKIVLFKAALQANLLILAVIGILATIISIYAYLKVIVALYMSPRQDETRMPTPPLPGRLAAMVVVVLLLWIGLLPGTLLEVIARAGAGF
jgi:NADH-quinone oxidoreductase subunit N